MILFLWIVALVFLPAQLEETGYTVGYVQPGRLHREGRAVEALAHPFRPLRDNMQPLPGKRLLRAVEAAPDLGAVHLCRQPLGHVEVDFHDVDEKLVRVARHPHKEPWDAVAGLPPVEHHARVAALPQLTLQGPVHVLQRQEPLAHPPSPMRCILSTIFCASLIVFERSCSFLRRSLASTPLSMVSISPQISATTGLPVMFHPGSSVSRARTFATVASLGFLVASISASIFSRATFHPAFVASAIWVCCFLSSRLPSWPSVCSARPEKPERAGTGSKSKCTRNSLRISSAVG